MRAFAWLMVGALLASPLSLKAEDEFRIVAPFQKGGPMPAMFSKVEGNLSPALLILGIPAGTKSLVLIVDDPDSPSGLWTHWMLADIPPSVSAIRPGEAPPGAVAGRNSFGDVKYDGPIPPSGTHHYVFHLIALDHKLGMKPAFNRAELNAKIGDGQLARCETSGTFCADP